MRTMLILILSCLMFMVTPNVRAQEVPAESDAAVVNEEIVNAETGGNDWYHNHHDHDDDDHDVITQ